MTRSPTVRFLLGLLITLGAVVGFSSYSLYRLHGLRKLQLNIIDLNRHDTLQLLLVQNDLNSVGMKLRDAKDLSGASIGPYKRDFDVLRKDLDRAVRYEQRLSPVVRQPTQEAELASSLHRFWATSDAVFAAAATGHEVKARSLASNRLSQLQAELATQISALLERNNAAEEEADEMVSRIYAGTEKDISVFLFLIMLAIVGTSLYLIQWNRKIFWQLESLSRQRRVLAARLISVQEEVLRSVSRELHDEFGQILTAVGAMLARAEKKGIPPDSPLRTELSEVRQITHNTLEKIRSLSQMLHPAVIDDYGLAKALEWYTEVFERQTGIQTTITLQGEPMRITGQPAIHCFRIMQEALNNAAKHSGTKRAEVEVFFGTNELRINVKDHGHGFSQSRKQEKSGLGLIAMRERAEIVNGKLEMTSSPEAGTTVTVTMPLKQDDFASDQLERNRGEVLTREYE
ncbi:MAG: sensor histidine kinase [Acidobacteriota bacterium]|nr:sensor histidine kinase [Acidobacteriota bacterium]